MKKSIVRSVLVLTAAILTSFAWAALDLEVTGISVSGTQISVTVHNAGSVAESAAIRVTLAEAGGGVETLQSASATLAAGATQTLTLTASHAITGIVDDPQPIIP